jgi:hypothetical protein
VIRGRLFEELEFTLVTPGDGDVRALLEKCETDRAAKAASAAGNEDNFFREFRTHWQFPSRRFSDPSFQLSIP